MGKANEFLRDTWDVGAGAPGTSMNCLYNEHTLQSVIFMPADLKLRVAQGMVPHQRVNMWGWNCEEKGDG